MADNKEENATLEQLLSQYAEPIKQLKAILQENNLQAALTNEDEDLMLLRYAIGFQGDVEKAKPGFIFAMETRIKHKVFDYKDVNDEKELLENTPHLKTICEYLPTKFFMPGPAPHSVTYRFLGMVNVNQLTTKVTLEQWEESAAVRVGLQLRFVNKKSREVNKLVQICTVLDLDGLAQSKVSFLSWFKAESAIAQPMAPELLKMAMVINTPWFFKMLYNLVSGFLNARTLSKVVVPGNTKKDILEALCKHYGGENNIPQHYGGKYDSSSWEKMLNPVAGFEEQVVAAGKDFTKEVTLAAGETIEILWRIQAKDIQFAAVFVQEGGNEVDIYSEAREFPIDNTFVTHFAAPAAGKVTITWNNKASYWNSKTIYYMTNVQKKPIGS